MIHPATAPSRPSLAAGIAAPLVYIATSVAGAALRPEYSHIADAISELIVAGAPNKLLLDLLFALYNLLVMIFAGGLLLHMERVGPANDRHTEGTIGAWALLGVGIAGLATLLFPMDPRTAVPTVSGTIHLVLAGLSSLLSILTLFLIGRWFGRVPGYRSLYRFSIVSGIVVLVTGAIAAYSAATASPIMGLCERVTIGSYLLWLGVTASVMMLARRAEHHSVVAG